MRIVSRPREKPAFSFAPAPRSTVRSSGPDPWADFRTPSPRSFAAAFGPITFPWPRPFIQRSLQAAFAVAARNLPHGLICELDHLRYLWCGESLLQSQQSQRAERNSNRLDSAGEQLFEFALVGIGKLQTNGAA